VDTLEQLTTYHRTTTWVALLRALEVEQVRTDRTVLARPILDLGCGDGYVSSLALGWPIDVGLDVDAAAVRQAVARGIYRLAIRANARCLPFGRSVFRTVYCNGAIEHMDDLDTVLSEIARVMAPGGVLLALVLSDRFREPVGWLGRLLGNRTWRAFNRLHHHVNLLSPEQWRSRLAAHRLAVKGVTRYGDARAARIISTRHLWSKLHAVPRWPFVGLRHGGNLSKLMPRLTGAGLRRVLDASAQRADPAGY